MIPMRKKRQDLESIPDDELIKIYVSTKSKESFGEIYRRYSSLVYGTCLKYLKSKDESYDTAMDVFESLMHKLPQQTNIRSFNTWIYHVTRNECFSRIRNAKKVSVESIDQNFFEENSDHFMENEGFLTLYSEQGHEQRQNAVNQALNSLKPEQQACIRAFYLDKLSYKQIEDQLGYPFAKVKSYIQNGKRNLKVILQKSQIRT